MCVCNLLFKPIFEISICTQISQVNMIVLMSAPPETVCAYMWIKWSIIFEWSDLQNIFSCSLEFIFIFSVTDFKLKKINVSKY